MKNHRKEIAVIVDTNTLIYSIKNKIDLKEKILDATQANRILVPECVLRELQGLSKSNYYAKAALLLADRFEKIESEGTGDECIIHCAEKIGGVVLTNDRELSSRIKEKGLRVLAIRRASVVGSA